MIGGAKAGNLLSRDFRALPYLYSAALPYDYAPHRCVLVIDATTGQNALSQAKLFKEAAGVDELILTKLDGTAKGGVAIAVAMQEKLPITYVGLGEKLEDLRPFNGADYARALLGDLDQGK